MSRRIFLILLAFAFTGAIASRPSMETQAQAGSASQMIAAINQLRANHGLGPLEQHPILMSIAQSHSNYQASIGQGTHVGPGGTSPKDRAIAAGFGGGATVYLSENWAAGTNLSIQRAIYDFWDDSAHMGTMLGTQYKYIGAGVAFDGNYVYYTVDTGAWVGDPNPAPPAGGEESPNLPTTTAIPVEKSTPNPDGSVIHVVRAGQTLWTIAVVYDLPLEELMAINGFNENTFLYVGDEVIIRPADASTSTPPPTSPPTPTATASSPTPKGATASPTPSPQKMPPTPVLSPTSTPLKLSSDSSKRPTLIIAVLVAGGAILVTLIRSLIRK